MLQKTALPICCECLGTAAKNCSGEVEALSTCSGCGLAVHLSCVTGAKGHELTAILGSTGQWHCEDCRTCAGCNQTKDQVSLLML